MPSKVTRNGSLPSANQVEVVVTPKRKLGSTSKGKEESSKGLQAKTPAKGDTINCVCGRNRESAAKDRRDWVQCQVCGNWSHPSCHNVAQVVVARDDVPFICFFCTMSALSRMQGLFKRYEVDQATKLLEEMEVFMKEREEAVRDIYKRMEELGRQIADSEKDILSLKRQLEEGTTVSASNLKKSKTGEDQQKARKGIRKLWGTNKSLHVSQARKRIVACCARAGELLMVRNFKRRDGKDIWWFKMSGEEDILAELELIWRHNYWKIERVHHHSRSISEDT